tara:strand:+ start:629 stop:838 length:210 start_codon:yes stop_codon:yes gene_type:complete
MRYDNDEVMEGLLGLSIEEMIEVLETMSESFSVEIGGNVYIVPESFGLFLEKYIRYKLGIDGISADKKN